MIEAFNVKDQAIGTGDNNVYTFDFRIFKASDLLIFVQNTANAVVQMIRGDDTTYLAGLVFDPIEGGGTVTLVSNLDDGFTMTFLSAPDLPDQPTSFPNKTSFTLDSIEGALDYLAVLIQRVAWLSQRSMRLHELDDIDSFDPTLPQSIKNYPGGIISVKLDGSGFEIADTSASASAEAAAASAIAAAASAAQAVTSELVAASGYYVHPATSRAAPLTVVAAIGFVPGNKARELMFVQSGGGNTSVTANPQVPAGSLPGQELVIVGCSATNTLNIVNGSGLDLNGNMTLGDGDTLGLFWDGANWSEMFRRSAT